MRPNLFDDVMSMFGAASRLHGVADAARTMMPSVLDALRSGQMAPEVVGEMVADRLGEVRVNGHPIQRSTIVRFAAGLTALTLDLERAQVFTRRAPSGAAEASR